MVDHQTVCCMCGDVGFPDKIFRCSRCRNRFQHSYCSSYYSESSTEPIEVCDWCQSEGRNNSRHGGSSSKKASASASASAAAAAAIETGGVTSRSEYSGEKIIKQHDRDDHKGKSPTPSPRTTTRRYKLLKDVMC